VGEISDEITDLSNYFVTEAGRDLLDVLGEAIGYASRVGAPLRVPWAAQLYPTHDTHADARPREWDVREEGRVPVLRPRPQEVRDQPGRPGHRDTLTVRITSRFRCRSRLL